MHLVTSLFWDIDLIMCELTLLCNQLVKTVWWVKCRDWVRLEYQKHGCIKARLYSNTVVLETVLLKIALLKIALLIKSRRPESGLLRGLFVD